MMEILMEKLYTKSLVKKKNQKKTTLKGKEYSKEDLFIKFSKAMLCSKWKRKKARFGTKRKKYYKKGKFKGRKCVSDRKCANIYGNRTYCFRMEIRRVTFWMEHFDIGRMLWMKKRKFILARHGQAIVKGMQELDCMQVLLTELSFAFFNQTRKKMRCFG